MGKKIWFLISMSCYWAPVPFLEEQAFREIDWLIYRIYRDCYVLEISILASSLAITFYHLKFFLEQAFMTFQIKLVH